MMWLPATYIGLILFAIADCTPILPQQIQQAQNITENADVILVTGLTSRTGNGRYPYGYPATQDPLLRKQIGSIPIRREIRTLKSNFTDQWNLYVLGLISLQAVDESDPVSFYEIAGIHGRPYKFWQGATNNPGKTGGYCPHGNNMFFGWHRPYVALFEQELYRHIQGIAQQFPAELQPRYVAAAQDFRIPYWDWALGPKGGSVPDFLLTPTIQVIATDGTTQDVPNPLSRYEFHPLISGDFEGKWTSLNTTVRWPTTDLDTALSQPEKVVAEYDPRRRGYMDKVSKAFTIPTNMNDLSKSYIEDVHGWIHYAIGGKGPDGHMWPADYSAFDPVFMLHHANVDRLFAIWQAMHPDLYITPELTTSANLWIDTNTVLDADTPLLPFWRTPDSFWTTNEVRDTTVLGYAYPETVMSGFVSDDEYRRELNATVTRLYSSSAREMLLKGGVEGETPITAEGEMMFLLDEVDRSFEDWNVRVKGDRMRLPATFLVKFFLRGDYNNDEGREVGAWTVVASAAHQSAVQFGGEEERRRASVDEMDMQGLVGLTSSLLEEIAAGTLASLDEEDVVPFLRDSLSWRVETGDGSTLSDDDLNDGLVVEVVSTRVKIPVDEDQLLEYSDQWVSHPEITKGKVGGVQV